MAEMSIPIIVDWESIKDYLKKADIVEVIRCKDCKKYFPKTEERDSYCPFVGRIGLEPDGYCAWAERRTSCDE